MLLCKIFRLVAATIWVVVVAPDRVEVVVVVVLFLILLAVISEIRGTMLKRILLFTN
jgi:hypothetical protein